MTTQHFATPTSQLPAAASHDNQDVLLKVSEVSRRLRVDDTTVRRWVHNGILDAVVLPHKGKRQSVRIRRQVVEDLINSSSTTIKGLIVKEAQRTEVQ